MRSIAEAFPNRICGVLRTENAEAGFQACLAALEAGVSTIEITKTVPSCFELIKGLIATTGGKYPIRVGTPLLRLGDGARVPHPAHPDRELAPRGSEWAPYHAQSRPGGVWGSRQCKRRPRGRP